MGWKNGLKKTLETARFKGCSIICILRKNRPTDYPTELSVFLLIYFLMASSVLTYIPAL